MSIVFSFLILSLYLISNTLSLSQTEIDVLTNDYNNALEKWNLAFPTKEDKNYIFRTNQICFCLPCFTQVIQLKLNNNKIILGKYAEESSQLECDFESTFGDDINELDSIDDLFDRIFFFIESNIDSLVVSYHPTLGYPLSISADISFQIADEEYYRNVECLTPKSKQLKDVSMQCELIDKKDRKGAKGDKGDKGEKRSKGHDKHRKGDKDGRSDDKRGNGLGDNKDARDSKATRPDRNSKDNKGKRVWFKGGENGVRSDRHDRDGNS